MVNRSRVLAAGIISLYSFRYPEVLIDVLHDKKFRGLAFLSWYWQTTNFSWRRAEAKRTRSLGERTLLVALGIAMAAQVGLGLWLVYASLQYQLSGAWEFGLALIISYPIVWANILGLVMLVATMGNIKRNGYLILAMILERQVRALRRRYQFKVIAVAGSVGKTSSKLAIANVLGSGMRVMFQEGNYNTRLTVPLVIFGQEWSHSLYDVRYWLRVIRHNQRLIRRGYPYDVVVIELGTDGPGQLVEFAYLKPDIAVVTAVAPEHMEFFGTVHAVAEEELSVSRYSKQLLINADDVAHMYRAGLTEARLYGLDGSADYTATFHLSDAMDGERVTFHLAGKAHTAKIKYLGAHGVKIVLSAVAVADILGMEAGKIMEAVQHLEPFSGRMQLLKGKNGSTIIDDTYNSSPVAAKAALDVLYRAKANKRIAILGSMNEMGETSQAAHEEVGAYCDPHKLDVVATIGTEANRYLAPAALKRGCVVVEFTSPYEAGEWAAKRLESGTVVLAKGSQNGVFAEEAVKALLADKSDESKLVRQSSYWMQRKRQQFPH